MRSDRPTLLTVVRWFALTTLLSSLTASTPDAVKAFMSRKTDQYETLIAVTQYRTRVWEEMLATQDVNASVKLHIRFDSPRFTLIRKTAEGFMIREADSLDEVLGPVIAPPAGSLLYGMWSNSYWGIGRVVDGTGTERIQVVFDKDKEEKAGEPGFQWQEEPDLAASGATSFGLPIQRDRLSWHGNSFTAPYLVTPFAESPQARGRATGELGIEHGVVTGISYRAPESNERVHVIFPAREGPVGVISKYEIRRFFDDELVTHYGVEILRFAELVAVPEFSPQSLLGANWTNAIVLYARGTTALEMGLDPRDVKRVSGFRRRLMVAMLLAVVLSPFAYAAFWRTRCRGKPLRRSTP